METGSPLVKAITGLYALLVMSATPEIVDARNN